LIAIDSELKMSVDLTSANPERARALAQMLVRSGAKGKLGEVTSIVSPWEQGPAQFVVAGLGPQSEWNRGNIIESVATCMRRLIERERSRIVIAHGMSVPGTMHDAIVLGAITACEGQAIYRSEPISFSPSQLSFCGISPSNIQRGMILAEGTNLVKRLVNEPPNVLYPESFANRAAQVAHEAGLSIEVWDEARLASEGCRAILAVGAGSNRPPRLVILKYQGSTSDEQPLALVGKGVTFDSGGLSLKPSESMMDMKCDMAGAATVLGAMQVIARLGIRRNVIGLCGLAENMVSGESYKLGDIIETRSGKTIEILNTDAEGRVVLADTLDVAIQHTPQAMVDLATLTGACMVALGKDVTGMMTNHQSLCDAVRDAATIEGEPVWQLPMFKLYDETIKSKVADIKNMGDGRWGGAISAAKFLENFVGDVPWVHMDIAGPAFADTPKPHRDAGATGAMLRTLVRWVETTALYNA
jgi:leucyl aminopeptidase